MEEKRAELCSCYEPHQAQVAAWQESLADVEGLSELFAALGVEVRTKIVYLLSKEEMCVCDLAATLKLSLPAISHHLRLLRLMRLVKYRKEGRMAYYSLADDHVMELIRIAQEHYEEEG